MIVFLNSAPYLTNPSSTDPPIFRLCKLAGSGYLPLRLYIRSSCCTMYTRVVYSGTPAAIVILKILKNKIQNLNQLVRDTIPAVNRRGINHNGRIELIELNNIISEPLLKRLSYRPIGWKSSASIVYNEIRRLSLFLIYFFPNFVTNSAVKNVSHGHGSFISICLFSFTFILWTISLLSRDNRRSTRVLFLYSTQSRALISVYFILFPSRCCLTVWNVNTSVTVSN